MKFVYIVLVSFLLFSCKGENATKKSSSTLEIKEEIIQNKEEIVPKQFTLIGTTWKNKSGGVIIFSDEKGKFLYGNEEKNKYLEGEYTKFGDKYSLKSADEGLAAFGFMSNFGSSPLVITIDDTNPKSFSFTKTDIEETVEGNYRKIAKTIVFTIVE